MLYSLRQVISVFQCLADTAVMTTEVLSDEGEGVYVMEDTLVYLVLSLLLCGLSGITALNQSGDSAKNSSWENSPIQTEKIFFKTRI